MISADRGCLVKMIAKVFIEDKFKRTTCWKK